MVGTTSSNKKFKIIHIIFTFIDFIALVFFAYRMFNINYANIYQYGRISGIEHLPFYFCLTVVLLIIFLIFIGTLMFCKKYNEKFIIVYAVFIIFIIIAAIIGAKSPHVTEYTSSNYNQSQSDYLPIDKFKYKENSKDYYYYRDVNIGKIHWIGSSSYKDFAAENTNINLTEEIGESTVFLNYYYLFDESNYLIKDYSNKKIWYDILSIEDYESEQTIDNYTIYKYEDCYELILESNDEVFYLSASKNNRTVYDENDLIVLANELIDTLRKIKKA